MDTLPSASLENLVNQLRRDLSEQAALLLPGDVLHIEYRCSIVDTTGETRQTVARGQVYGPTN
jgi:hypothetical protein